MLELQFAVVHFELKEDSIFELDFGGFVEIGLDVVDFGKIAFVVGNSDKLEAGVQHALTS